LPRKEPQFSRNPQGGATDKLAAKNAGVQQGSYRARRGTRQELPGAARRSADHIDTRSFGEENQLTADQTKEQTADHPDLTADDRQQMLNNLQVMVLANNRRGDVT